MQRGADIADRLLRFGAAALRLSVHLPNTAAGRHVGLQWVRAATSAGANYEEARAAESRGDFIHKVAIAAKEAREARYWLSVVHRAGWIEEDTSALAQEGGELAAILLASARTARAAR